MAIRDTWFDVYARAQFGTALRAGLALGLALAMTLAVLLLPLGTLALRDLVARNQGPALGLVTLRDWLLSPAGLWSGALAAGILVVIFYLGQAALIHIAAGAGRGATPRWVDALTTALAALPRLLRLAVWQAGALALPLLVILAAGFAVLLGPRGGLTWLWAGCGMLGLAVLLSLLGRWSLGLPVTLYEGLSGRAALRRAVALGRPHRWRALWLLILNLALALALAAGLLWLAHDLLQALLAGVTPSLRLVNRTLLALALLAPWLLVVVLVFTVPLALVAIHLYLDGQGLDGLPLAAWQRAARSVPLRGLWPAVQIWGLLALSLLGTAWLVRMMTDDLQLDRPVLVVAHRGSSATAPENTLSALYQALADGADLAEIDVQQSADGVLVLLHDPDLRRVAGIPKNVWELGHAELRRIDVGRWFDPRFVNETVTTLEEALKVAEGRLGLNIELKFYGHDQGLAKATAELLRATGCRRCLVTSTNPVALARIQALAPGTPVGLVVAEPFRDLDELAQRVARARGLPPGALLDLDLLSIDAGLLTRELVRANRAAGRATHAWTVDDPVVMARLIDWGVDAIITNHPARLRRLLDERARMSDRQRLLWTLGRQWGGGGQGRD